MGFSVQIQADYGSEKLQNVHPDGRLLGGAAVFAFWGGLFSFREWKEGNGDWDDLMNMMDWYQGLDQTASEPLCPICDAFLDCVWGDGGDSYEYHEDDYELFQKRTHGNVTTTEEQFRFMVQDAPTHWKPIGEVTRGVQLLLALFKSKAIESLSGFYEPANTIPDFEALYANLELLAKRGNNVVRLLVN